jgi:alkylation response protein AidB-like acyl-CoA dehydrogenase
MDFGLTDEQDAVVRLFAKVLTAEVSSAKVRACELTGFDHELWLTLLGTGIVELGLPPATERSGEGLLLASLVVEECGRVLAPAPVVDSIVAGRLLARLQSQELLERLMDGSEIVATALHSWRQGPLELVPTAALATRILCRIDDAVVALPSEAVVRRAHWRALSAGSAAFVDIANFAVGQEHIVAEGPDAIDAFNDACLDWKILTASALTGLGSQALKIGTEYAMERHAFGRPIARFQAISHRLADAHVELDGARLVTREAAWAVDAADPRIRLLAAMALYSAASAAAMTTGITVHVHGGYGLMEEGDIQLYYRRAKSWPLVYGDPRSELLNIADELFGPPAAAAAATYWIA